MRRKPKQDLNAAYARFRAKTEANIKRTGRSILGVFPDEKTDDPANEAFQYSIGNALKGLPELLLVGLFNDTYAINELSALMIKRGRKFEDGEVVDLGGKCPVIVYDADDFVKDRYTIQATRYLGTDKYEVMQIVIPDREGRFPWQAGCDEPYRRVIVHRRNKPN